MMAKLKKTKSPNKVFISAPVSHIEYDKVSESSLKTAEDFEEEQSNL
jgi:hypothetical protein